MGMLGASKEEIYRRVAEEIGGEFVKGGLMKGHKVVSIYKNWTIVLDTYTQSTGKTQTTYTRVRATFISKDDLRFKIYKSGVFSGIGKLFGMDVIKTGDPSFDEAYILKGNKELILKELFSNLKIQELFYDIDKVNLEIKDSEGMLSNYPDGTDLLYFRAFGVIKDIDKLKKIIFLFCFILELFVVQDIALDIAPEKIVK